MSNVRENPSDWQVNNLGLLLAIALALACLLLYVEHERLGTVCALTGDHENIFGDDAQTPRQVVDSICSGMPLSPERPEQ